MNIKNLILVRHAKSNWDTYSHDIERPLERRGIDDIKIVSKECIKFLPPTVILFSSPAKRARETALIFAATILYPLDSIVFDGDLYTFDENKLEKYIKSIPNDYDNVILFGHNDAITNFVNKFGTIFVANVPTSGLVWLQFETDSWAKLKVGKTIEILFPKNLK